MSWFYEMLQSLAKVDSRAGKSQSTHFNPTVSSMRKLLQFAEQQNVDAHMSAAGPPPPDPAQRRFSSSPTDEQLCEREELASNNDEFDIDFTIDEAWEAGVSAVTTET